MGPAALWPRQALPASPQRRWPSMFAPPPCPAQPPSSDVHRNNDTDAPRCFGWLGGLAAPPPPPPPPPRCRSAGPGGVPSLTAVGRHSAHNSVLSGALFQQPFQQRGARARCPHPTHGGGGRTAPNPDALPRGPGGVTHRNSRTMTPPGSAPRSPRPSRSASRARGGRHRTQRPARPAARETAVCWRWGHPRWAVPALRRRRRWAAVVGAGGRSRRRRRCRWGAPLGPGGATIRDSLALSPLGSSMRAFSFSLPGYGRTCPPRPSGQRKAMERAVERAVGREKGHWKRQCEGQWKRQQKRQREGPWEGSGKGSGKAVVAAQPR